MAFSIPEPTPAVLKLVSSKTPTSRDWTSLKISRISSSFFSQPTLFRKSWHFSLESSRNRARSSFIFGFVSLFWWKTATASQPPAPGQTDKRTSSSSRKNPFKTEKKSGSISTPTPASAQIDFWSFRYSKQLLLHFSGDGNAFVNSSRAFSEESWNRFSVFSK